MSPLIPIHSSNNIKCISTETDRKDIERTFGVAQQRFKVLRDPCVLMNREDIDYMVQSCFILHNMIVKGITDIYM